jgi:hypothetical protein
MLFPCPLFLHEIRSRRTWSWPEGLNCPGAARSAYKISDLGCLLCNVRPDAFQHRPIIGDVRHSDHCSLNKVLFIAYEDAHPTNSCPKASSTTQELRLLKILTAGSPSVPCILTHLLRSGVVAARHPHAVCGSQPSSVPCRLCGLLHLISAAGPPSSPP